MKESVSFVVTGDSFITRRNMQNKSQSFYELKDIICKGDVKFTNLEVTTHDFEGYPHAFSGGTWAIAEPNVLKDIKAFGFNLVNCANNHAMDYSEGGLLATIQHLKQEMLPYAGIGKHLAEASKPTYIETENGRIALVAVTTTFHESWMAGEQRKDMKGRPGVNGLRINSEYTVEKKYYDSLKSLVHKIDINAQYNLDVKEGFAVEKENVLKFGQYDFVEGTENKSYRYPHNQDKTRIIKSIMEAKRQADFVLVSIHSHEMEDEDKSKPAEFMKQFARECIDAGACAILGHGPHILRGIEIYKHCPIFYSLGNFIFQNDTVSHLPADFYNKYSLSGDCDVAEALDVRNKDNTIGLGVNPYVWESVIAHFVMDIHGLKSIELYPIDLGFDLPPYRRGWPALSHNKRIVDRLTQLSAEFGTKIVTSEDGGMIKL